MGDLYTLRMALTDGPYVGQPPERVIGRTLKLQRSDGAILDTEIIHAEPGTHEGQPTMKVLLACDEPFDLPGDPHG